MADAPRPCAAPLPYDVVRSRRRTLVLHVLPGGRLEVRAPLRMADRRIAEFVESKRGWVVKVLARTDRDPGRVIWREPGPSHGDAVPLRGLPHRVALAPQAGRRDIACALLPPSDDAPPILRVPVSDDPASAGTRLLAFYRSDLEARVAAMLPGAVGRCGAIPSAIGYRSLRSRWGSCARDGRIVLNVLCAALPDDLVEYVLCHELCHLRHLDHSRAFWNALARALPDAQARRHALRGWYLR